MTTHPYVREVEYLSPSSLAELEQDPVRFYLRRCAPEEYKPPRMAQTGPMGVGCVFDSNVKFHLSDRLGRDMPENFLAETVEAHNLHEGSLVLYEGLRAFYEYIDSPALGNLQLSDIEVPAQVLRIGSHHVLDAGEIMGVPIWGKPDALRHMGATPVVVDWKVTGSLSGRGKPEAGYRHLWKRSNVTGRWIDEGPHPRCMEPLETLNAKWATQCVFYGWMLGGAVMRRMYADIEQVVMVGEDWATREVWVAQFRAQITEAFQEQVLRRLVAGWKQIKERRLLPPGTPPLEMLAVLYGP